MPNLMNIANSEAQDAIVTFGRDMSVAESTTMTITENGTYDVRKKATVIVEVEGNPNHKETKTGTCNSFVLPEGFVAGMQTGDASMTLMIDLTTMGFGEIPFAVLAVSDAMMASFCGITGTLDESYAITFLWYNDGSLQMANALMGGTITDLSSSASTIGYTATLYYHTMPEEA